MAALHTGRALLQACKQGVLASVKAYTVQLLAIPNAKETNPPMRMAMGEAAYRGHANSLRHLMASLPREHWKGCSGPWDPLVFSPLDSIPQEWRVASTPDYVVNRAAAGGIPDALQALIDAGLMLNHQVERMGSPLSIAILHGHMDLVRFLLSKGADPNNACPFPSFSLLHEAALVRSTVMMQLLLDHGATMRGSMALEGAARVGSIEAAALALALGEDVNEVFYWGICDQDIDRIGTALHVAVQRDHEAMVAFLLQRGARQDLLNGTRATVKALAAEIGNPRMMRLLQQYERSDAGNPL